MAMTRREFVVATGAAMAAGALSGCAGAAAAGSAMSAAAKPAPPRPLKLLILGGTAFLGPELVEAARARGHKVTLFNRGKTNPGALPGPREAARRPRRPSSTPCAAAPGTR